MNGVVLRVFHDKGFGFVGQDPFNGEKTEYFFHRTVVIGLPFKSLKEGSRVEFEPGNSPKGPRAVSVTPRVG
jgi:cold shock protein